MQYFSILEKENVLRPHPHRTPARKFERKSFDVACVQCGHSHSHQQVPFSRDVRTRSVWMRQVPFGEGGEPFLPSADMREKTSLKASDLWSLIRHGMQKSWKTCLIQSSKPHWFLV